MSSEGAVKSIPAWLGGQIYLWAQGGGDAEGSVFLRGNAAELIGDGSIKGCRQSYLLRPLADSTA